MIPISILEKLVSFTDEEIDNLNDKNMINKSIFMNNSNTVDYHKMLMDN